MNVSREIKFRCYMALDYNKSKKMFYNYDPFILGMDNPKSPPVMQYTGLKDKNGKEIYDGDIVRVKYKSFVEYRIEEVIFTEGAFGTQFREETMSFREQKENGHSLDMNRWEVIGNIYENPELLENNK